MFDDIERTSGFFWAKTVSIAKYNKNKSITRNLVGRKWHNKKSYLGYFATFNEKIYVLDKSPKKGKMDPRGIHVCRSFSEVSDIKDFRIWIPSLKKIVVTREVKFLLEIQKTDSVEDIVCDEIKNGRFMLDDNEKQRRESAIGPSRHLGCDEITDNT